MSTVQTRRLSVSSKLRQAILENRPFILLLGLITYFEAVIWAIYAWLPSVRLYFNTASQIDFWWYNVAPIWKEKGFFHTVTGYAPAESLLMLAIVSFSNGDFGLYIILYYVAMISFWVGRAVLVYATLKRLTKHYLIITLAYCIIFDFYSWGWLHHIFATFFASLSVYLIVKKRLLSASFAGAIGTMSTFMDVPLIFTILKAQPLRKGWKPISMFLIVAFSFNFPFLVVDAPALLTNYIWQFTRRPVMSIWGQLTGTDVFSEIINPQMTSMSVETIFNSSHNWLFPLSLLILVASLIFIKIENVKDLMLYNGFVWSVYIFFVKIGYLARYYILQLPYVFPTLEGTFFIALAGGLSDIVYRIYYCPTTVYLSGITNFAVIIFLTWRFRKNIYFQPKFWRNRNCARVKGHLGQIRRCLESVKQDPSEFATRD